MKTVTSRSMTAPLPLHVCRELFLNTRKQYAYEVVESKDGSTILLKRSLPINEKIRIAIEAVFESIHPDETRVLLNASLTSPFAKSGPISWNEVLTEELSALAESCLADILARTESDAKAILSTTTPEAILCPGESVPESTVKLLQELKEAPFYLRIDAAKALGMLGESKKRIVAALMMAGETDKHTGVRDAAKEALGNPVHQAILEQDPEWTRKLTALTKLHDVQQLQDQQVDIQEGRRDKKIKIKGGVSLPGLFFGALGLGILSSSFSGDQVILLTPFGKYPVGPVVGILFILAGVVLNFISLFG